MVVFLSFIDIYHIAVQYFSKCKEGTLLENAVVGINMED